jgi:hypothetical protein
MSLQLDQQVNLGNTLFIMGEHAHSRCHSEDAYELAAISKELYIVPNAGHVDLYDKTDLIPFDRLEAFFTEHLSNNRFKGSNHHRRSEGTTVSLDWWFRCHR